MIKGKGAYIILGVIVVVALFLRIFYSENKTKDTQKFILEGATSTIISTPVTSTPVSEPLAKVIISTPEKDAVVSSPLVVKGEVRGNWFFEASLPVKLTDDKGQIIATTPAAAGSDWMTENFVPFSALLEFNTTATSGYLIIAKDNPSGLPENDDSFRIPIKFLNK